MLDESCEFPDMKPPDVAGEPTSLEEEVNS